MFGCHKSDRAFISLWTAIWVSFSYRFFLSYVFIAMMCFESLCWARRTIAKAPAPICRFIWKSLISKGYSSGLNYFLLSIVLLNYFSLACSSFSCYSFFCYFVSGWDSKALRVKTWSCDDFFLTCGGSLLSLGSLMRVKFRRRLWAVLPWLREFFTASSGLFTLRASLPAVCTGIFGVNCSGQVPEFFSYRSLSPSCKRF